MPLNVQELLWMILMLINVCVFSQNDFFSKAMSFLKKSKNREYGV